MSSAGPSASLAASTRLGPYEVTAPLGAGGMGEVYRARDTRLDRDVAIKLLPPQLAADPQFRARFEREAKSVSGPEPPAHLHDPRRRAARRVQGEEQHYLVLELIEGESLAQRLAKGPLPLREVLRLRRPDRAALDAAHRRGIVHRDLKPGNVMLTRAGAKLLDFGLAARPGEGQGIVAARSSLPHRWTRPLTEQGTIVGTFQYMAPEQLEGQAADARTDIFALGALLYEMATGRRAFEGKTPHEPDRRDRLVRAARDLERAGHVAAGARPRGAQVPGEGSRGPLAERARRRGRARLDRRRRLARRSARDRFHPAACA